MEWGDLPLDEHLLRQKVHISVRHQGRLGPYVPPCVGSVWQRDHQCYRAHIAPCRTTIGMATIRVNDIYQRNGLSYQW